MYKNSPFYNPHDIYGNINLLIDELENRDNSENKIDELIECARKEFFKKYGKPNEAGRNRFVWLHKYCVIKFPINEYGLMDNANEYQIYKLYKNGDLNNDCHYAKCRLVYFLDIPVIIMEKVNISFKLVKNYISTIKNEYGSDWTYCIDGGQVGINSSGKLVAYDYGRY